MYRALTVIILAPKKLSRFFLVFVFQNDVMLIDCVCKIFCVDFLIIFRMNASNELLIFCLPPIVLLHWSLASRMSVCSESLGTNDGGDERL